jgi:hypothetical protein
MLIIVCRSQIHLAFLNGDLNRLLQTFPYEFPIFIPRSVIILKKRLGSGSPALRDFTINPVVAYEQTRVADNFIHVRVQKR